jgi:hypothetical protein
MDKAAELLLVVEVVTLAELFDGVPSPPPKNVAVLVTDAGALLETPTLIVSGGKSCPAGIG